MSRIDWIILRRLLGSLGTTLAVAYGIALLLESLNTGRFDLLTRVGGLPLALLATAGAAARDLLDVLTLLFLIGSMIGLLSLQASREMTIIKASGISIWRSMRAPVLLALLFGLAAGFGLDAGVTVLSRSLSPSALTGDAGKSAPIWLREQGDKAKYMMQALYVDPSGEELRDVTVFNLEPPRTRIEAPLAELKGDSWVMPTATEFRSNTSPAALKDYHLPSSNTRADLRAKLTTASDQTAYELIAAIRNKLSDPTERQPVLTRLLRLIFLPLALVGSVTIAFAFTAHYRRTNTYGLTALYGIGLGCVVYVLAELASRAASAGVLPPAIAVLGPSLLAIVAGATVLLNKEDGQT